MRKRGFDRTDFALRVLELALVLFVFWLVFERGGLADVRLADATLGEFLVGCVTVGWGLWTLRDTRGKD